MTGSSTASASTVLLIGLDRLAGAFCTGLEEAGLRVVVAIGGGSEVLGGDRASPDLTIIGGGLHRDPLELIHELSMTRHPGKIVYLVDRQDAELAMRALTSGAHEVIPPPHTVSSVLFRAKLLCRQENGGRPSVGADPASRRVIIDRLSRTILDRDFPASLTGREFELLERLIVARGRVVPRDEILLDIWGDDQGSEAVLDATVHRLRKKLESNPASPRILTTVRGIGYRLEVSKVHLT